MKPRVYILSRAPILGLAKTRLASDIGKVHAHRIYKGMIAKVIKRTHDPRWEVIISGTPSKKLTSLCWAHKSLMPSAISCFLITP